MLPFILFIIPLFGFLDQGFAAFTHFMRPKHTVTTFSARLIHRSSPESPLYDPSYTRDDHIRDAVRNSLARSRYFSQRKAKSAGGYIAAPASDWSFIMEYAMGTPPVKRYGIFDTGSSLIWFQCHPCTRCFDQGKLPLFYPEKSSSFQPVVCNTFQCDKVPGQACWTNKANDSYCHYQIRYEGDSESQGIAAMETLTLPTKTVEKMIFGCGTDSKDSHQIPGIVGASNDSVSLIRQLSVSHFSYYLFANGTNITGEVHFGPGASLSDSVGNTPFIPSSIGFFYLDVLGISVNDADLDLPPGIFDKASDDSPGLGFIIDSGTTYTSLRSEAFDKLKDAVMDEMYMYDLGKHPDFELCFKDYIGGAPELTFIFRGLDYVLCESNAWVKREELYCLAILRSKGNTSILGIHQQRNVQVGYDLQKNLLTMNHPETCPDDVIDFL